MSDTPPTAKLLRRLPEMSFPACPHKKRKKVRREGLDWLGAEPYRIFFATGILWSVVGVALWPLFYQGLLATHPLETHARLMIEGFGGGFVLGFLGTAGPRMASAPRLSPIELVTLVVLHTLVGIVHLRGFHRLGDLLFAILLVTFIGCLVVRIIRFRKEPPPHQLVLAFAGLLYGATGAIFLAFPSLLSGLGAYRLPRLLLDQGLLLPPILGMGSFVFPRILGGGFGEASTPEELVRRRRFSLVIAILIGVSFVIDAYWSLRVGVMLRVVSCLCYLLIEIPWFKRSDWNLMTVSLRVAILIAFGSLALSAFADSNNPGFSPMRVSVEHLLYLGGYGLLIFIVAGRVLFGHAGELEKFSQGSWMARILVFLLLMTALTRAVPAMVPKLAISHHQYAAVLWVGIALAWAIWHRRRFVQRDEDDDD